MHCSTLVQRSFRTLLLPALFAVGGILDAAAAQTHATSLSIEDLRNRRVLILGDSITQNGGWVSFLEYELVRALGASAPDVVSIGLSSETVSGLTEPGHPYPRPCVHDRIDRALDLIRPDVVFACYGMNDGIYHPQSAGRMAAFTTGVQRLSDTVRAAGASLILITPPVFDSTPIAQKTVPAASPEFGYGNPYEDYDAVLADYAKWELREAPAAMVIDVHGPMRRALDERRGAEPGFAFATDGVHPGESGHLLTARAIAAALGIEIPETTLESGLKSIQSDPLYALVAERRRTRSEGWLAYVGYTRGDTVRSDSIEETEAAVRKLSERIRAQH